MPIFKMISVERLRKFFSCDPQTGEIRWIVGHSNYVAAGALAGHKRSDGYHCITVDGEDYKAHRIMWALHYGEWPTERLDHINRDPSDNRIANLRQASHGQNIANTLSKTPGRPKGVYWHKQNQYWVSSITIGGRKKHLGVFQTESEAAAAFEKASREVYGDFTCVEAKPCL
jgi:HNH endonuclease